MWFKDLKQAIEILNANPKYEQYVFERVVPGYKCVVFFTTHFTIVRVYRDGKIEEVQP
jgi:hypothetical protein